MNNFEGFASGLHVFENKKDQWNIETVKKN